ncbi:MAG: nucleoside hydrolase [Pseudomonadota bacterium]
MQRSSQDVCPPSLIDCAMLRPMAIPVILDTDIGMDVDDVWALAFLLRCPELDLQLVLTECGDTRYAAAVAAKVLLAAGRSDVPVAVGLAQEATPQTHAAWLGDFCLEDYPGVVHEDGMAALREILEAAEEPVTIIAIGPVPNLAALLDKDPALTAKVRLVGMLGSLRRGYLGAPKPMREYNVMKDPAAAARVLGADWPITITPLDSCGDVILDGNRFARLRAALAAEGDPLLAAVLDNHSGWFEAVRDWPLLKDLDPQLSSSILYDTVAVYLAFSHRGLLMERLPVKVDERGRTMIDEAGVVMDCAMGWEDRESFLDLLTERLTERLTEPSAHNSN